MRILFVSNLYPPNVVGGYERLCFEVASAFVARGHDVFVLTSDYGGEVAEYPGQSIERSLRLLTGPTIYQPFAGDAEARARIDADNVDRLQAFFDTTRPDFIYCWNLFFLDRSFLDALARLGVPAAVMLTDNWLANMIFPERVAAFFREHVFGTSPFPTPAVVPPKRGLFARLFGPPPAPPPPPRETRTLDVAAIYGAEFMRTFYRETGLHFPRETVIHNGVVLAPYAGQHFRDRTLPAAAGEFRILFAGRLVDLKGADTVISALDHLSPASFPQTRVRLTLLGDAQDVAYVERLRAAIAAYRGPVEIEQRPTVSEAALLELFEAHDVYVFPSLYEPFSLTLIHALGAGIPTIASDAGGNTEIVRHDVSGLIYPKGDAPALARSIERMAADPALRERLSLGGREAAKGFDFANVIEKTERYIDELRNV